MLGLRFYFNEPHNRTWPTDGTMDWLWPAAERARIPIALAAASFLPTVGEVAARHLGLKLIVDHMAVPRGAKGAASYRTLSALLALAKHPKRRGQGDRAGRLCRRRLSVPEPPR